MSTSTEETVGTVEVPDVRDETYRVEEGDHERYSHYAPRDEIAASWITGDPVTALCGKRWVPTRDPERFPVCPRCREKYEAMSE